MALTPKEIEAKTEELKAFIAEHKDVDGPLMPIMQKAQELFGYLSLDTQELIADSLGIPSPSSLTVTRYSSGVSSSSISSRRQPERMGT